MKLKDRDEDLLTSLEGSTLSMFPPLGQMFSGLDAYKKSKFEIALNEVLEAASDDIWKANENYLWV